jgi:hypothetical protein
MAKMSQGEILYRSALDARRTHVNEAMERVGRADFPPLYMAALKESTT